MMGSRIQATLFSKRLLFNYKYWAGSSLSLQILGGRTNKLYHCQILTTKYKTKLNTFDQPTLKIPHCFLSSAISHLFVKVEYVGNEEKIGLITLHRPKSLNAYCDMLMIELTDAVKMMDRDQNIGSVIITGSEKALAAAIIPKFIKVEYVGNEGKVGLTTLHEPKSLNTFCDELMMELTNAVKIMDKDQNIEAIIITISEKPLAAGLFFNKILYNNKRQSDDLLESSALKTSQVKNTKRCTDLIVFGLSMETTENKLREYFEPFGEVLKTQVKKGVQIGQSERIGWVRFGSFEVQQRVLTQRHMIDGRICKVKLSKSKLASRHLVNSMIHVRRCPEDITTDDLRDYFSKFGEVTDVHIPKPSRRGAIAFVTFLDAEVVQKLCGIDHFIKGSSVDVYNATFEEDPNRRQYGGGRTDGGGRENYEYNQGMNNGANGNQGGNRGDMPNLGSLGLGQGGLGNSNALNMGALTMTMLAALSQAGWGLLGNLQQNLDGSQGSGGYIQGGQSSQVSLGSGAPPATNTNASWGSNSERGSINDEGWHENNQIFMENSSSQSNKRKA